MNCFNHRDRPAIGLCKGCAKALCGDCLTELPNGLACKGSCEDRVNLINRIIDRNPHVIEAARRQVRYSGLLILLIGIGFILFAIVSYLQFEDSFLAYLLGFMGGLFVVGGILRLDRKGQYPKLDERKPQS
jgi:hypothetical protein